MAVRRRDAARFGIRLKDAALISVAGQGLVAGLGMLGLVLVTRALSKADFASLQVMIASAVLLAAPLGLGQVNAMLRFGPNRVNGAAGRRFYRTALRLIGLAMLSSLAAIALLTWLDVLTALTGIAEPGRAVEVALIASVYALFAITDAACRTANRFLLQQAIAIAPKLALIVTAASAGLIAYHHAYPGWLLLCAAVLLAWVGRSRLARALPTGPADYRFNLSKGLPYLLSALPVLVRGEVLVLLLAVSGEVMVAGEFRLSTQLVSVPLMAIYALSNGHAARLVEGGLAADQQRLVERFDELCRVLIKLVLPFLLIGLVYMEALIRWLFGDAFEHVVGSVSLMCLYPLLLVLLGPLNLLLIATNRARLKLLCEVASALAVIIGYLCLAERASLHSVAALWLLSQVIWTAVAVVGLGMAGVPVLGRRALANRLAPSLGILALVWGGQALLSLMPLGPLPQCLLLVSVGLCWVGYTVVTEATFQEVLS